MSNLVLRHPELLDYPLAIAFFPYSTYDCLACNDGDACHWNNCVGYQAGSMRCHFRVPKIGDESAINRLNDYALILRLVGGGIAARGFGACQVIEPLEIGI